MNIFPGTRHQQIENNSSGLQVQLPFLETCEAPAFLASYVLLWDAQTLPLPQHRAAHKNREKPGETTGVYVQQNTYEDSNATEIEMCIILYHSALYTIELCIICSCSSDLQDICPIQ